MAEQLSVSVVYALPDEQVIVRLDVARGTTAAQAIELSKLSKRFLEIESGALHCAVYGRGVPNDYVLAEGDRVEILRPLLIDPKENRRQAAARTRAK